MKVFVTGGTGFVGNYVIEKLLAAGYEVRALVRNGSEKKLRAASKCEIHNGDTALINSFRDAIKGCGAVVHLVGIIRQFPAKGITFEKLHVESTKNAAYAAIECGVKRFVQMSALGARPDAPTKYWSTKWAAEEYLRSLSLDLTIFRPSTIIGAGGEFAALIKQMVSAPLTPVIGSGENKMQPVAVWNVAEFFTRSIDNMNTVGKAFEIGGPEAMSYNRMLRIAGEVLGKNIRTVPFPSWAMKKITTVFEKYSIYPITADQLAMLSEDSVCDNSQALADMPVKLADYREAISKAFGK